MSILYFIDLLVHLFVISAVLFLTHFICDPVTSMFNIFDGVVVTFFDLINALINGCNLPLLIFSCFLNIIFDGLLESFVLMFILVIAISF